MWLSSFLRTRRQRPCAAILVHSTRTAEAHEALQQQGCPDPCSKRDAKGFCQRARNSSVEQDVLYFVFPNSAFTQDELALETINTKLQERAFGLYNKLRGAS